MSVVRPPNLWYLVTAAQTKTLQSPVHVTSSEDLAKWNSNASCHHVSCPCIQLYFLHSVYQHWALIMFLVSWGPPTPEQKLRVGRECTPSPRWRPRLFLTSHPSPQLPSVGEQGTTERILEHRGEAEASPAPWGLRQTASEG